MAALGIRRALAVAVAVVQVGCGKRANTPGASLDPSDSPAHDPAPATEPPPAVEPVDGPPLTREEIRMVVRAKLPEIRACFERERGQGEPALRERVQLRFTIEADGKAREITIVETQTHAAEAGACLAEQLARWQFPRPRGGGPVVITYPFVYSSEASLRAAGLPRVEGTLAPEAVGAVFEARRSEVDVCLAEGASGTIGVALSIDDAGRVTRISSYADELPDGAGSCVVRTISTWTFPPAAGGDEARVNHDLRW